MDAESVPAGRIYIFYALIKRSVCKIRENSC